MSHLPTWESGVLPIFQSGLQAIGKEQKMLRSPETSPSGKWSWQEVNEGHRLVGVIQTDTEGLGSPSVHLSVYELDKDACPVRWFGHFSRSATEIDFQEEIMEDGASVRRKWQVSDGTFVALAKRSKRSIVASHDYEIPTSLVITDNASLLTSPATTCGNTALPTP